MEFGQAADPRRKIAGISIVVLWHLAIVWGLANGLGRKVVELLPPPLETKILKELVQQEDIPPPPPPKFDTPPPPFIPPPEINIQQSEAPRQNTITTVSAAPPPPVAAPVKAAVRTKPVVKAANCSEPEYPSASQRLGEAGAVVLSLLVGVDGTVTDRRVAKSSGFERLDIAALEGLSRCLFKPGTVDGVPEPSWANIRYEFKTRG